MDGGQGGQRSCRRKQCVGWIDVGDTRDWDAQGLAEEWEGRAEWGPTIVLPTCARTREGRRDGGIIVNDGMTSRGGVPTVTREDREMEADIENYIDACRRVVIDRDQTGREEGEEACDKCRQQEAKIQQHGQRSRRIHHRSPPRPLHDIEGCHDIEVCLWWLGKKVKCGGLRQIS